MRGEHGFWSLLVRLIFNTEDAEDTEKEAG